MDEFTHCVKCGAEKTSAHECPSCGAIYEKAERLHQGSPKRLKPTPPPKEPPPKVLPCSACGQTVSVNALACPYCGEPKAKEAPPPQPPQPGKKTNVGARTIMAALVVCAIILPAMFNATSKAPSERDMASLAGIHCQEFVKTQLKAPSTADFPSLGGSTSKIDNSTYLVRSYVDAQNSFGATIRSNWICKIQYKSGDQYSATSWKLIDLEM